jgi:hypothetical protein
MHKGARLLRRSQIEDAPPPYIRQSRHESMNKGDLPPVPPMAARPQGTVSSNGNANAGMSMAESSWTTLPNTLPTQPTQPYYPHSNYAPTISRFST